MFCTKCGAQLADGSAFCTNCGSPVKGQGANANQNDTFAQGTTQAFPATQGAQGAQGAQSAQGAPAASPYQDYQGTYGQQYAATSAQQAKKLSKPMLAIIAASAVAAIAIVCVVVFLVRGGAVASADGANSLLNQSTASATSAQSADSTEGASASSATSTASDAATASTASDSSTSKDTAIQKSQATMQVSQVDNSSFPQVTLYASLVNSAGEALTNVTADQFQVYEYGSDGTEYTATIAEIAQLAEGDAMSINLVLDQSASMKSSSKMSNAKTAALKFIDQIAATSGAEAEVTSFDDYVYNRQPFTSDSSLLQSAVNSLTPTGDTALNDALYWAIQRTNQKSGSRVVIAFTDGVENASKRSTSEVIELSRLTGIPVYIIGVGNDVKASSLKSLATSCNGTYYDADTADLANTLASIYAQIYSDQRAMFRVVFTSSYTGDETSYRTLKLTCSDTSAWTGSCETSYVPQDNVSVTAGLTNSEDYVLPDSSSRVYSRSELEKLSLWELYLARNEIFARYGRGFKNQDLVEYFATRTWYTQKYTPEEFDAMDSPLNTYEQQNTKLMLEIERERNSPYLVTAK